MAKKRKSDLTREEIRAMVVGGKTVADWDKEWEPLPNAYSDDHPDLRHVMGLFRTLLDGETKYISKAVELKGGIAKGLKRISGPKQTGNRGYGARMIRRHFDQVEVEILRVEESEDRRKVAEALKREMNRLYDPVWGIPAKRRMKMIREGLLPPD